MKYLFLGLYALMLCIISYIGFKKTKTLNDFFLGGRKTGPWMSAFAYGTTYFSAVIFIGYAGGTGWEMGLSAVLIGVGNALIGSYLAWKVLGRRTHQMTRELGASTMPEFFEKRYQSRNMKIFTAVIIFIFLVPYCASVYQGLSYLFEQVFGIPFFYCIIAMAVLTGMYLLLGGYFATTLTDFFQGIIMLIGLALMMLFVFRADAVGGFFHGLSQLKEMDPALVSLPKGQSLIKLLSLITLTSLGSWGLPQMVHKFYAIRDVRAIRQGTVISTLFALVISGGAYLIGIFGRLFLNNTLPIDPVTGVANADLIIPTMLQATLPAALMGLVVVLVLSASMSTLSSLVLVSSSAISMDLIKGVLKPNMDQKKVMLLMRLLCGVFILASVVIAVNRHQAILSLMSFSWGTISGTFLGAFVFGLYDKRTNARGAWAGMILGFATNMIWAAASGFDGSLSPLIGSVSMMVSLITVPLASRLLPKKAAEAKEMEPAAES